MNSYLRLTAAEANVYNREVEAIEPKERLVIMEFTNEWIEAGKQEGRVQMLVRLMRCLLGSGVDTLKRSLMDMPPEQLDAFSDELDRLKTLADAQRWLAQHA